MARKKIAMEQWPESNERGRTPNEVYAERESSELPEYRISGEEDEGMQDVEMRAEAEDEHPYSLNDQGERSQKGSRGSPSRSFLGLRKLDRLGAGAKVGAS